MNDYILEDIISKDVNDTSVGMSADTLIKKLKGKHRSHAGIAEGSLFGQDALKVNTREYYRHMLAFNEPVYERIRKILGEGGDVEERNGYEVYHTNEGTFALLEDKEKEYPEKENMVYALKSSLDLS